MAEKRFPATDDQLEQVQAFVAQQLEAYDCPARVKFQLENGTATVRCCVGGDPLQVTIQFLDSGKPFDPLAREDADTTLSAEDRGIGGLGILMVKKSMDAVGYAYENGSNVLTIKKNLTQ